MIKISFYPMFLSIICIEDSNRLMSNVFSPKKCNSLISIIIEMTKVLSSSLKFIAGPFSCLDAEQYRGDKRLVWLKLDLS